MENGDSLWRGLKKGKAERRRRSLTLTLESFQALIVIRTDGFGELTKCGYLNVLAG